MKLRIFASVILLSIILTACGSKPHSFTSDQIVTAFKDAGLEAEDTWELTVDDYGLAPYVGSGVRFLIPSLCEDCGGRVFVFESDKDLQSIKDYYETIAEASALFFSWIYVRDNALVQINGDLPENQALKYKSALMSIP